MFASATKCGHCGASGTKAVEIEPADSTYKQVAICCIRCSAILGITGFWDAGALLKEVQGQLIEMDQKLTQLQLWVQQLSQRLR
jgi:hypothetical protein